MAERAGPSMAGTAAGHLTKIDKLPVIVNRSIPFHTVPPAAEPSYKKFPRGTLDRGTGLYKEKRDKLKERSLVETGKHQGRSRVRYAGFSARRMFFHFFKRDFFITVIDQQLSVLIGAFCLAYLLMFFFWSLVWFIVWRVEPTCLSSTVDRYASLFIFATYTQQTIGYGNYFPQRCGVAVVVLILQTVSDLLMDAIMIGVLYSRISHPKQRARTIFVSDRACIARRDSILKFMFRVADIRTHTQVVDPKVRVYLYTWGNGRRTAEGEFIPVRAELVFVEQLTGELLVPKIVEHTIDERSPLYGHTHESLLALTAEIVVTFEATTEFGNPFMVRQSYLPDEIWWGYQFVNIVYKPPARDTRYLVDLSRFHEVEPQPFLPLLPSGPLSKLVVSRAVPTVPFPLLGENTLVVSSLATVCKIDNRMALTFRVGDTYGYQILESHARCYLYRWGSNYEALDYNVQVIDVGYRSGDERLLLRLPSLVIHYIDERSPLRNWLKPGGILEDADSELVLMVDGYIYLTAENVMRQRTYNVYNQVKVGYQFADIVSMHSDSNSKMVVDWSKFNDIEKVEGPALLGLHSNWGGETASGLGGAPAAVPETVVDNPTFSSVMNGPVVAAPSRPSLEQAFSINLPDSEESAVRAFLGRHPTLERYKSSISSPNATTALLKMKKKRQQEPPQQPAEPQDTSDGDTYMTS